MGCPERHRCTPSRHIRLNKGELPSTQSSITPRHSPTLSVPPARATRSRPTGTGHHRQPSATPPERPTPTLPPSTRSHSVPYKAPTKRHTIPPCCERQPSDYQPAHCRRLREAGHTTTRPDANQSLTANSCDAGVYITTAAAVRQPSRVPCLPGASRAASGGGPAGDAAAAHQ